MDVNSLIDGIKKLLDYMFAGKTPELLLPVISWIISIVLILAGLVFLLGLLKKLWTEFIQPAFYDSEDTRRRFKRQMFSDHIESEIRRLNNLEAWNDNRFAELEAFVEAEGRKKLLGIVPINVLGGGIRLERSLSKAMEHSTERLILLEGDPGSGKSVALRHVAQSMATNAYKSRNLKTRIPIYINLKYLRRNSSEIIDRKLIEHFIYRTINRVNDRDIDQFLHDEFNRGLIEGTWLFLFDSFDEIPEILSSIGTDDTIRIYAEAIQDFLSGMNKCKGIIASREYKGPKFLGWPKFRILPLTMSRRARLIKRTGLPIPVQQSIVGGLSLSAPDFKTMASNPMFLNLICEYMNKSHTPDFPTHTYVVFEEYVNKRLSRDQERLLQRFNKAPFEVKEAAEKLAFCMTADKDLGLGPSLDQLENSTNTFGQGLGNNFDILVNSLEYLKLARIETSLLDGKKYFTFAHRRFQEYFATAVVLREPQRVDTESLLTNGRWRETTVVMLQTQKMDQLAPIFAHAQELLKLYEKDLGEPYYRQPISLVDYKVSRTYLPGMLLRYLFESVRDSKMKIRNFLQLLRTGKKPKGKLTKPINWPNGLYHLLSIFQDGIAERKIQMPRELRQTIDKLLIYFFASGDIVDKKLGLELVGIGSPPVITRIIQDGFEIHSTVTRELAFRQVSKLDEISKEISKSIFNTLIRLGFENSLFDHRLRWIRFFRVEKGVS